MTYKEFKQKVKAKFSGYEPTFERNEIQYVAHIGHGMICYSNPYTDYVNCYWHDKLAGQF